MDDPKPRRTLIAAAYTATVLFMVLAGVLAIFTWPGHTRLNPVFRFMLGLCAGGVVISVLIPFVGFFEYLGPMKRAKKHENG